MYVYPISLLSFTFDNTQKISKLDGAGFDDLEGLKKKKQMIRGDWG